MNIVLETIKNRRSIRTFKSDQISKENLDLIIEAGIYAPTACNEQPWHFTVIQNSELLQYINKKTSEEMQKSDTEWIKEMASNPNFKVTYDSPTLIIVSGRKDGSDAKTDCSAAIQNMLLAAESLGIGSVWLGLLKFFFNDPNSIEKVKIPEGYEPFYGVSLGYNSYKTPEVRKRNLDVVTYI